MSVTADPDSPQHPVNQTGNARLRRDESLNCFDRLLIDFPVEIQQRNRGNPPIHRRARNRVFRRRTRVGATLR